MIRQVQVKIVSSANYFLYFVVPELVQASVITMKAIYVSLFSVLFFPTVAAAQIRYKTSFTRNEAVQFLNQELNMAYPRNPYTISLTEDGKLRITRAERRERIIDITVLEGASNRPGEVQAADGFSLIKENGSPGYYISFDRSQGATYGSIEDLPELNRAKNIMSALVQLKTLLKTEHAGRSKPQPVKDPVAGTNDHAAVPDIAVQKEPAEKIDYDNITSEGLYEMLNQLIQEKGVGEKKKINGTKYGFMWCKGVSMDLLEMSNTPRYSNTVFLNGGVSVVEYESWYGVKLQSSKLNSKGEPERYQLAKFHSKKDAEKAFDILVSLIKNVRADAADFLDRNKSLNDYLPGLQRWLYLTKNARQDCEEETYVYNSWLNYDNAPTITYRLETVNKPVESLKEGVENLSNFNVTRTIYTASLYNLSEIFISENGRPADCETGEVVVYFTNNSVNKEWTIVYDKHTAKEMKTKARQNTSATWGFSLYYNPGAIDPAKLAETLNILKLIARKKLK